MLIIGDVLAFLAGITLLAASSWALTMCTSLMFPGRTERARDLLFAKPWQTLLVGILLLALPGTVSVSLLAQPLPGLKLLGWIGLMLLLAMAAVGSGGLATLVSARIRALAPELTLLAATGRASAIIVTAALFPVLGWFVFTPLTLLFSLGAGFRAIVERDRIRASLAGTLEK